MQAGEAGEQQLRPGVVFGQVQPGSSAGAGEPTGDGEQPQPQPLGFPAARVGGGEGKQLGPGGQVAGEGDQGAPDPVLVQVVQRQVGQPGVFCVADAVLAAGPAAVPQLEVGQLTSRAAGRGVGRERGDPVAVDVLDPQWAPGWGRFLRMTTRIPAGQRVRSSMPVSSATNAPSRI